MLVDFHSHTSGISKCCKTDSAGVIEYAKKAGIDGLVITNHYQKAYVKDGRIDVFADRYIDEYKNTEKLGAAADIKIFFGVEVTMQWNSAVHILIYGITEKFVRDNPAMFEYSQHRLYESVKEYGGVMIQAHPFRNDSSVLDTSLLDGVEINCHPLYKKSYSDELLHIAHENGMILTCGGDFHADTYRAKCGVFLPDDISDGVELGKYISDAQSLQLCIQEPNEELIRKITYYKNRQEPDACFLKDDKLYFV